MTITLELEEMSTSEKIGLLEDIWTNLSHEASKYSPPDWHNRILEEREALFEAGKIGCTDWNIAKAEIKERVS
ncbi:MAG: addiction module protein [Kiritimatiellae bacterium]|jgi:hypothetical protein|nr:addiction module protein [Kiritimatiellia bacterium]